MPQGIVISLEILAIGMGDRGSKSDFVCKRATSRRFFHYIKFNYKALF